MVNLSLCVEWKPPVRGRWQLRDSGPPHAVHPSNFFRQAVGRGFCIATHPICPCTAGQWADRGTPLNLGAFRSDSSPPKLQPGTWNKDKMDACCSVRTGVFLRNLEPRAGADQPARPETGADQGSGIVSADQSRPNRPRNLCRRCGAPQQGARRRPPLGTDRPARLVNCRAPLPQSS